ncbi:Hypothetical_protein [Hexamita inflata]|uniref:Hypothetical_protein n=1 Tax=Hexamita inflata TaxID=28002 RepID=A0AA86N6Z1_9EUKA|nr:Hypothetical protein HINF_LOCUS1538 [Hexamita inflata]
MKQLHPKLNQIQQQQSKVEVEPRVEVESKVEVEFKVEAEVMSIIYNQLILLIYFNLLIIIFQQFYTISSWIQVVALKLNTLNRQLFRSVFWLTLKILNRIDKCQKLKNNQFLFLPIKMQLSLKHIQHILNTQHIIQVVLNTQTLNVV